MPLFPGHEAWLTRDYGGEGKALSLTQASLGTFVFHCLNLGGHITGGSAFAPGVPRSYVQLAISLPAGKREALEGLSGITLEAPTALSVPLSYSGSSPDPLDPDDL